MADRSDTAVEGLRSFGDGVRYSLAGREIYVDSRRVWTVIEGHSRTGKVQARSTGSEPDFPVRVNEGH
jgi:hypothetical protein